MLAAFLLGLMGSVGHCVGMCTGVMLLLGGRRAPGSIPWLALHLGRISSYALLGLAAGGLGGLVASAAPGGHAPGHAAAGPPILGAAQGGLALLMAALAAYMVLALLGKAPSPEVALAGLTRRWGQRMRRTSVRLAAAQPGPLALYGAGLLWGMLPCGLVLTALIVAASTLSAWGGALAMLAFGLGTWPALLAAGWLAGHVRAAPWPRYAAAALVALFGVQMAFRGLAAWGWVEHLHLGRVMVW